MVFSQNVRSSLPEATAERLPRWRGFNLLEKFHVQWSNGPYRESDFKLIHELGFNFVRLPMDYRIWIKDGDWNQFDEEQLEQIDQAVHWGQQYGIHVCLNFHRAPGYTVNSPKEPTDLWSDEATQQVCAKHWSTFARRYRDVPNRNLSFNLFNEPPDEAGEAFISVTEKMVTAIRREDPKRLIISDGLNWGQRPVPELKRLGIAQATRGYAPFDVTHYLASWVDGADRFPVPAWPRPVAHGVIYAPDKSGLTAEHRLPLSIHGSFSAATQMRFKVDTVSTKADFVVMADGKPIFEKLFTPGPGAGEWKTANYLSEWNTYQNVYDRSYSATIPVGTKRLELKVRDGDWISISEIAFASRDRAEDKLELSLEWGKPPARVQYDPAKTESPFQTSPMQGRQWLWETTVLPWVTAKESGIGVLVGEFGCYRQTPHTVTLAWMEDCLANWQRAEIGWSLWNFRGDFGVLDSHRSDVQYEDFHGHQLDRQMLDLLMKY